MSATGRKKKSGEATERKESDFYPTPRWCVTRLLRHLKLPGGHWLEPSAGDGAIIKAVSAARPDVIWWADEIRPEAEPLLRPIKDIAHLRICDFLRAPHSETFDVCLGNPPFSLAADFILKALQCSNEVVMLLRLNFLGSSNGRRHLFESAGMPDVFVLADRPSFTGEGTDACEYAWMRWTRFPQSSGRSVVMFDEETPDMFAVRA